MELPILEVFDEFELYALRGITVARLDQLKKERKKNERFSDYLEDPLLYMRKIGRLDFEFYSLENALLKIDRCIYARTMSHH